MLKQVRGGGSWECGIWFAPLITAASASINPSVQGPLIKQVRGSPRLALAQLPTRTPPKTQGFNGIVVRLPVFKTGVAANETFG